MKTKLKTALLYGACFAPIVIFSQTKKTPEGSWSGAIQTPGGKLELVIKLKQQDNGEFKSKLYVPAQGAKDIPASKTKIVNDSVTIEFAMLRAVFKGLYMQPIHSIKGEWTQNNYKFPLELSIADNAVKSNHKMQEPLPPFDYNSEEVSFTNKKAGITIAGTLTYPKNKNKLTTVILISGSGAQNRNEEIAGHKPFLVIADYLTKNGYAVLRCDDRGVGGTGGNPAKSTSLDFAEDAEAAINFLKTRAELNPAKIGLMGHSEGGAIAPIVASRNKNVAFVIMLAGPGINCTDLMVLQAAKISEKMGIPDSTIQSNKLLNKSIYELAKKNEADVSQKIKEKLIQAGIPANQTDQEIQTMLSPWYRTFLSINPNDYLPMVKCPLLALNGKKDLQVPFDENLSGIEKLMAKNKNHKTIAYPNLNHLFQNCESGLPSEYADNKETFAPVVLSDIKSWLDELK